MKTLSNGLPRIPLHGATDNSINLHSAVDALEESTNLVADLLAAVKQTKGTLNEAEYDLTLENAIKKGTRHDRGEIALEIIDKQRYRRSDYYRLRKLLQHQCLQLPAQQECVLGLASIVRNATQAPSLNRLHLDDSAYGLARVAAIFHPQQFEKITAEARKYIDEDATNGAGEKAFNRVFSEIGSGATYRRLWTALPLDVQVFSVSFDNPLRPFENHVLQVLSWIETCERTRGLYNTKPEESFDPKLLPLLWGSMVSPAKSLLEESYPKSLDPKVTNCGESFQEFRKLLHEVNDMLYLTESDKKFLLQSNLIGMVHIMNRAENYCQVLDWVLCKATLGRHAEALSYFDASPAAEALRNRQAAAD
jgi:hypothetical protein